MELSLPTAYFLLAESSSSIFFELLLGLWLLLYAKGKDSPSQICGKALYTSLYNGPSFSSFSPEERSRTPNKTQRERAMEIIIPSSNFIKPSPVLANVHLLNLSPAYLPHRTKPLTLTPNPIVLATWKRRRSGSRKSHPISLESLALLASNLRILPEPLDFVVREFAGGSGGKIGFRNGFGGGGSDGSGRRGKKKLGLWAIAILVVSGFLMLCVVLEGGKRRDLAWAVPILLAMVVYCSGGWWKREIRGWLLGFCCGASMVGLGLQNGNFVRLSRKFRAYYRSSNPIEAILGKKTRRRR